VSNEYLLDVVFAPSCSIGFGSNSAEANTTFQFDMRLMPGQIVFESVVISPEAGQWLTDGFSVGQKIGTLTVDGEVLDLVVREQGTGSLTVDAIEPGDEEPELVVQFSNSPQPEAELSFPAPSPFTVIVPEESDLELRITEEIFRLPATSSTAEVTLTSQPDRMSIPDTAFSVRAEKEIVVN
jgi:hypothetical protein